MLSTVYFFPHYCMPERLREWKRARPFFVLAAVFLGSSVARANYHTLLPIALAFLAIGFARVMRGRKTPAE